MSPAEPWLLVIDPQAIFADPDSAWGSPFFEAAWGQIERLVPAFEGRVLVTRWLPTAARDGAWGEYFEAWPFADVPADHPRYALIATARGISDHPSIDEPTFGKWQDQLRGIVGEHPRLVVTGVSTDCCVIATVLPAADAGAWVTVVSDAVAHSSAENGKAALDTMALFAPQVTLATTDEVLAGLGRSSRS